MSSGDLAAFDREVARAIVRRGTAGAGFRLRDERIEDRGWWAVLGREEDDLFVFLPRGGTYLTLSVSLAVAETFWRDRLPAVLDVASGYDVAVSSSRDTETAAGEIYVNLALRLFLDGLPTGVVEEAAGTLTACRDAILDAFTAEGDDGA